MRGSGTAAVETQLLEAALLGWRLGEWVAGEYQNNDAYLQNWFKNQGSSQKTSTLRNVIIFFIHCYCIDF